MSNHKDTPTPRTPLDRMIDAACGINSLPTAQTLPHATEEDREDALLIASSLLGHLRSMYPEVLKKIPATCQRSIRGTIHNDVVLLLRKRRSDLAAVTKERDALRDAVNSLFIHADVEATGPFNRQAYLELRDGEIAVSFKKAAFDALKLELEQLKKGNV